MQTPLTDKSVYVVGESQLQSSLIASFLNQATGAKCEVIGSPAEIPEEDIGDDKDNSLVLWNCFGKDSETWLLEYDTMGGEELAHNRLALFNVSQGRGIEEKAIPYGAEGFFYEQDLAEHLERGIRAIFAGELWISRKILADYLRKNNGPDQHRKKRKKHINLTRREREVLTLVASGARNAEIAATLYVSHHTVRTHLFNIYKKIDVPNRFQAILWATENL
jgi:DNA-binding CsgD family transcriptional regulator